MGYPSGYKTILNNDIRFSKPSLYITSMNVELETDVVFAVIMNARGIWFHCFFRIEDRGQFLIVHSYQVKGFLC